MKGSEHGGAGKPPHQVSSVYLKDNATTEQRLRLLVYLERHGSITKLEARRALDILHPAGRVLELRQRGYNIMTVWANDFTSRRRKHRVARYILGVSYEQA